MYQNASTEPLGLIEANECSLRGDLRTIRFQACFNEIIRLHHRCETISMRLHNATREDILKLGDRKRMEREVKLLQRIIYKMQMPANVNRVGCEFLDANEIAAYRMAISESI